MMSQDLAVKIPRACVLESAEWQKGFADGMEFFCKNVWHEASEEPKKDSHIVVYGFGKMQSAVYVGEGFIHSDFTDLHFLEGFEKWAYIVDMI